MGRHRRNAQPGRRRRPLVAVLLGVGMIGVVAGATTVSSQARAGGGRPPYGAKVVADPLGRPLSRRVSPAPTPSPTATPSASASPSGSASDSPSGSGAASPSDNGESARREAPEPGTTVVAPADQDSAKVGALFQGSVTPGNHFCTASVLHSPTHNLVLTAAHCLGTADGVSFVPGYRDGNAPYGTWQVTKVYTDDNWSSRSDPDTDFAILQVAPNGGRNIEDVVGGNALGLNADFSAQVEMYGYPENTEEPIVCTNDTSRQATYQRRIDCPSFPSGTSGGPWLDTSDGKVIGVIGGYQQGGSTDDISYSAYFDHSIGDLYNKAVVDAASQSD